MSFVDWLYGKNGLPGDYDYTMIHFVSVGVILALTVILALIAGSKHIGAKAKKVVLYSIATFQIVFEVVWRIVYVCRGDDFLSLWPFYACNLNGILYFDSYCRTYRLQTYERNVLCVWFCRRIVDFCNASGNLL